MNRLNWKKIIVKREVMLEKGKGRARARARVVTKTLLLLLLLLPLPAARWLPQRPGTKGRAHH